jgi:hypothetical protein
LHISRLKPYYVETAEDQPFEGADDEEHEDDDLAVFPYQLTDPEEEFEFPFADAGLPASDVEHLDEVGG